jgi:hypothetical protein
MKKLVSVFSLMVGLSTLQSQDALWEPGVVLSVGGSGTTSVDTSNTSFGANVGVSYEGLFNVPLEVGVRQGINYSDVDGSTVGGSTGVALDLNFYASKRLAVFGGVATDVRYADGVNLAWFAGPEAGVKVYLFQEVFVFGRVNYDLRVNERDGDTEDAWRYTVGMAVKF